MNKSELIDAVASTAGLTKKDSEKAVNALVEVIKTTLAGGERVQLVGFGTFEVRDRKARTGLNPQTREPIQIPATKVPAFKAGKAFKDIVANK